jgi:hypothetical protein
MSDEHFTVGGNLIVAWALPAGFPPQGRPPSEGDGGGNPKMNFHGERRLSQTHASTTYPEAQIFRKGKGKEGKFCFMDAGMESLGCPAVDI